MTDSPAVVPVQDQTGADPWLELVKELDRWRAAGLIARFWWRDDDAVALSPALEGLFDLCSSYAIPLGLSVIPQEAEAELARPVSRNHLVSVLQHGIAHRNNAAPGCPASIELGGTRSVPELSRDLLKCKQKLADLFGAKALPVLVPPWNMIDDGLIPHLPGLGYLGLSTAGLPQRRVDRLIEANANVQPISWAEGPPRYAGTEMAMRRALLHLRQRREREVDPEAPIGLLTHHRDSDEDTWAFVQCFLGLTKSHPAVAWITPAEAFRLSQAGPVRKLMGAVMSLRRGPQPDAFARQ